MAGGDENLPKDAKTIIALLKSVGIDNYEPRVVRQFLELYYRTAVELITDAQTYSDHAGKARIDQDDVTLAINSKSYFSFTGPPPPEVKDAAMKVNSKPIPRPLIGPSLPPAWDTLIASSHLMKIQKNRPSEVVEEQEVEDNVGKSVDNAAKTSQEMRTNVLPGTRQRVSFPLGSIRRR
ncbi:putative transcription factor Hap3/NF-YB family [Helianthus anomalus]